MHKLAILMVVLTLCLPLGTVSADTTTTTAHQPYRQSLDLAAAIDARAASNGLLSGDGTISSAEQAVADAVWNEINSFDQAVTEFENESSTNSEWAGAVEQAVTEYDQQIAQIESQPVMDPRAEAISAAVAQYGRDIETLNQTAPLDPRAEAISAAVDQYVGPREVLDPRAEAISAAVAQYNPEPLDPRAEAISQAVAQYGLENPDSDSQTVTRTVRQGTRDYINRSNVRRPGITKRYIDQMIDIIVPGSSLPINGYWRPLPFAMERTGNCLVMTGDNDGPPTSGNEEDPGQPLCGYENEGSLPFIVWNGDVHPYMPGTASMYGLEPDQSLELVQDTNGQTTGSMAVRRTVVYEVVAPDTIVVHLVLEEVGGCSMSGDYVLELVTPDESVCASIPDIQTQEEEKEQQREQEEEEPPLPVDEGPYTVGLPYENPDPSGCNELTTPPDLSEIRLLEQANGSITIDYGTGQQTVYPTGGGLYMYNSAFNANPQIGVTLNRNSDGTGGVISWLMTSDDGGFCSTMQDFYIPGSPSDPATAPQPDESGSESGESGQSSETTTSLPPVPGSYTVTWTGIPGLECPEALLAQMPTYTEATITQVDNGYEVQGGGQTYLLANMGGQFIYMPMNEDGSGAVFNLSGLEGDPTLYGSYNVFTADGQFCLLSTQFTPK